MISFRFCCRRSCECTFSAIGWVRLWSGVWCHCCWQCPVYHLRLFARLQDKPPPQNRHFISPSQRIFLSLGYQGLLLLLATAAFFSFSFFFAFVSSISFVYALLYLKRQWAPSISEPVFQSLPSLETLAPPTKCTMHTPKGYEKTNPMGLTISLPTSSWRDNINYVNVQQNNIKFMLFLRPFCPRCRFVAFVFFFVFLTRK